MKKNFFLALVFLGTAVFVSNQTLLASTKYTVQKKDNLYSISRRYHVSVSELSAANGIKNPHLIKPGQTLIIPDHAGGQTGGSNYYSYMNQDETAAPRKTAVQPEIQEAAPELARNDVSEDDDSGVTVEEHVIQTDPPEQKSTEDRRYYVAGSLRWWFASLDANAQISANGIIGTDVDLVDDLGVDDSAGIPIINAWVQPFTWLKIQGEYMSLGIDGSRAINESIVFDGTTFSISDNVTGELDVDRFSGWVEINPINGSWGYIGIMVGGEYVHLEGKVSSDLAGSASGDFDAGTLTLGGQAGFNITENLDIHARIRGMSFDISGVELDVFDIEGGIGYTLADHFELSVDYRYLTLDVNNDDDSGELTLQGPVVGGRIKI